MPIVDLGDGRIVEFPDLPPEQLQAAVASAFAQSGPPPSGDANQQSAPAPEQSMWQRIDRNLGLFGAGANDSIAGTIGGLPDLYNSGLRAVGLPAMPEGYYRNAVRSGIDAVVGDAPVPETTSERLLHGAGRGVTDAATMFVPAGQVARAAAPGSVTQGVAKALATQPVMQATSGAAGGAVGEATGNPWLGLAAGLAVPAAAALGARAVTPIRSTLNVEQQRLADIALRENIPLTAGQRTGSPTLRLAEDVMERNPMTSGPAAAQREAQQTAFNRAVLSRAGANAEHATPDVLTATRDRIGAAFDDLSARNTLQATPDLNARLATLRTEVNRYATPDVAKPVLARLEDVTSKISNGRMSGGAYRELDSAIGRHMRGTSNGDLRGYLGHLREVLRDGMDQSISSADRTAWREARQQYANLMSVSRAMDAPSAMTSAGNISPAALGNASRSGLSSGSYARGRGDLNDLARIGQTFLKTATPDSGTAQRTAMTGVLGSLGAGVGAMAGGSPGAMIGALGGLAAPRALQMAYNSGPMQRYLTNQLMAHAGRTGRGAMAGIAGRGLLTGWND